MDDASAGQVEARCATSDRLGKSLSSLDDGGIRELVADAAPVWRAFGGSYAVVVDGQHVFVKRVPVTDVEMEHVGSTRNLFGLPVFYSYGVGSAGFGVFRERAAHEQATALVRSGVTGAFPLLHHSRIVPRSDEVPPFPHDLDEYRVRWAGDEHVRELIEARDRARHDLWTFSEAVPEVVHDWVPTHLDCCDALLSGLFDGADALASVGALHFDAHFGNALTDGTGFFLSDFGLAVCADFELDELERAFLEHHRGYDHALVVWCLGVTALRVLEAAGPARRSHVRSRMRLDDQAPTHEVLVALVEQASDLTSADTLGLPVSCAAMLERFGDVILSMDAFLGEIRRPEKAARYDGQAMAVLLSTAGVDVETPRPRA